MSISSTESLHKLV